jgi:hypothetical protein
VARKDARWDGAEAAEHARKADEEGQEAEASVVAEAAGSVGRWSVQLWPWGTPEQANLWDEKERKQNGGGRERQRRRHLRGKTGEGARVAGLGVQVVLYSSRRGS